MEIEGNKHKMKQEWSLLDPIVDLFEKIEEGVEFSKAATTPIPVGEVVNISYLLILRTGEIGKSCEQWEEIPVGQKTWQAFNNHFTQAYRRYQIHNKATAAVYGYGAAANHAQETDTQMMTADALIQALANATIEDKEEMRNLTNINLNLS